MAETQEYTLAVPYGPVNRPSICFLLEPDEYNPNMIHLRIFDSKNMGYHFIAMQFVVGVDGKVLIRPLGGHGDGSPIEYDGNGDPLVEFYLSHAMACPTCKARAHVSRVAL